MNQRLIDLMKRKISQEGPTARLRLALSINRGERMIDLYLKGTSHPRYEQAYALAKECEATDEEAHEIARGSISRQAKETA